MQKRIILWTFGFLLAIAMSACVSVDDLASLVNAGDQDKLQGRWCKRGDVGETLCYEFVGERIVQFTAEGFGAQHEGRYEIMPATKQIRIDFFGDGGFERTLDYALQNNEVFLSGEDPVAGGGGTGRFAKQ